MSYTFLTNKAIHVTHVTVGWKLFEKICLLSMLHGLHLLSQWPYPVKKSHKSHMLRMSQWGGNKSHFTLQQIQFHIGTNPISHWNKSNITLDQIQIMKKSILTLKKMQFNIWINQFYHWNKSYHWNTSNVSWVTLPKPMTLSS